MKIIQIIKRSSFVAPLLLLFLSCEKYLDVKPEDSFLDEQIYSSKQNIYGVLNGFYLQMANADSYGQSLTMTFMDVLGQYYNVSNGNSPFFRAADMDHTDETVMDYESRIWSGSYNLIKQINVFNENVKLVKPQILNDGEKNILLGEALGLRAFLHFDLLRCFGPVYSTNPEGTSITYSRSPAMQRDSLRAASAIADLILKDLDSASTYLQQDPIIREGVRDMDDAVSSTDVNFFRWRSHRFNYYAVQALRARVLLYIGKTAEAHTVASQLIEEASKWFPFTPANRLLASSSNPDRKLSREIVFGIHNQNLYTTWQSVFSGSLPDWSLLAPLDANVTKWFPSNEDLRLGVHWMVGAESSTGGRTSYKFVNDQASQDSSYYYFQPLMRFSELYYIAAETAPTLTEAVTYLQTVRFNRGYEGQLSYTNQEELKKALEEEYRREFSGEGQLFFFYKRRNYTSIPSGKSTGNVSASDAQYVFPLPLNETNYR